MTSYRSSPYIYFIENRLFPNTVYHAVAHRMTGEVVEILAGFQARLREIDNAGGIPSEAIENAGRSLVIQLIEHHFLVSDSDDPLSPFWDYRVTRPIQNPAVAFKSNSSELVVARTSVRQRIYAPGLAEAPAVIEEELEGMAAQIFLQADGSQTLREVLNSLGRESELRAALNYLTDPERQLIKLSRDNESLSDPFRPVNSVPRDLCRASQDTQDERTVSAFHRDGITDADWEFDWVEPTVNHAFRFPSQALGGMDYGSRFCEVVLRAQPIPESTKKSSLNVLEVGAGTGSFARSFLGHAKSLSPNLTINYQILELAPALKRRQAEMLASHRPSIIHHLQEATGFDLPQKAFDLIIANEMIADLPVSRVERETISGAWRGDDGYLEKYGLAAENMPETFYLNTGVFRFLERCSKHLAPGGQLIVSEYSSGENYSAKTYHLNHDEFSIHFGHVERCARSLGFDCEIVSLIEFLGFDPNVLMLNGEEERLLCLRQVLGKRGVVVPYAAFSRGDWETQFGLTCEELELTGLTFSPLLRSIHYGPKLEQFMVAIIRKPK